MWNRLPTIVRAAVVAYVILVVGQLPPGVFVLASLRLTPAVPWFLPLTAVWLWLFWRHANGHGWPSSTASQRRRNLRARSVPPRTLRWALLAGILGMVSVMSLALLTGRIAELPEAAFEAPFDVSVYPRWTVVAFFMNVAMVAGVVEEAAFRGHMLSEIQRRHGWTIGILTVALAFFLVHVGHAYATPAFLPFFTLYSILQGVLVLLTRSIVPSVVLHALGDAVVIPIQYGELTSPLGSDISTHVMVVVGFGLASACAFARLAAVAPGERREEAGSEDGEMRRDAATTQGA